ncbi:MAG: hypothetical protein JWR61_154 [Ferruginibacter sp.]|nr:hypothetical protein [Ferruginibacter sp.]
MKLQPAIAVFFMSGSVHFLPKFQTNAIHFRWLFYFNIFLSRKKEVQYF